MIYAFTPLVKHNAQPTGEARAGDPNPIPSQQQDLSMKVNHDKCFTQRDQETHSII